MSEVADSFVPRNEQEEQMFKEPCYVCKENIIRKNSMYLPDSCMTGEFERQQWKVEPFS